MADALLVAFPPAQTSRVPESGGFAKEFRVFSNSNHRSRTVALFFASICAATVALASLITHLPVTAATTSAGSGSRFYSPLTQSPTSNGLVTPASNTITVNSTADPANGTDGL